MKKILIIDDEKRICDIVKAGLEHMGAFEVNIAFNGEDGIMNVKSLNPDLILLDINMPGMNGIEVLKILKRDENTKAIPVIILTAIINELNKKDLPVEYIDQYLEKPVDLVFLKTTIEEVFKKLGERS
ncbi:MAG: response regulator [bacterium]|nr:response regulator [bacterium]